MPERTSHPHGTPSWVDLSTPDVAASTAFYGALFGWESGGMADEESGGYDIFMLRGKRVAGVGPIQSPETPPSWNVYVTVDDVEAAVAKASDAGGQVAVPPTDVFTAGKMAFVIDPAGAFTGLWQPQDHIGAELVNETGTFGWEDLMTRDTDAALAFYTALFGWEGQAAGDYTVWLLDGEEIGGMAPLPDSVPAEVPSHWMAYFFVDDADATAAQATELGGGVVTGPFDQEDVGRVAILRDAHGAVFTVVAHDEDPNAE